MGRFSRRKQSHHVFNMELIIYATFLLLSLIAYAARQVANKGEEKKVSVSNINFKSFQKSFFLVYFLALLGDWLQGPYVYKLYAYYGFKESQIAILYVVGFASSVILVHALDHWLISGEGGKWPWLFL